MTAVTRQRNTRGESHVVLRLQTALRRPARRQQRCWEVGVPGLSGRVFRQSLLGGDVVKGGIPLALGWNSRVKQAPAGNLKLP